MQVPPPDQQASSNDAIARRLTAAIDRVGSRAAVARLAGVAPSTLHLYVNGAEMKLSTLVALAEACGVSPAWLVSGDPRDAPEGPPPVLSKSRAEKGFYATEDQAPAPRAPSIDPDILAQAMQIVEAIAATSQPPMPLLVRARRIAVAYDQLTLPDAALDPLPPYVPRGKP